MDSAPSDSSKARRVVLTGASGTLGSRVLAQLAALGGVEVLALLREGSRVQPESRGVRYERIDFFDREACPRVLHDFQPEVMIHCAASGVQIPKPQWFELIRFNVDTTIHLCECLSRLPGCRLVFIGTGLAYRDTGRRLREDDCLDTLHPYGASKAAADLLVRSAAAEFGVPLTVLRPFSFTGINDTGSRLFPNLLRAAAEDRPAELSPGTQMRDHCGVEDIAAGVVRVALDATAQGVFNMGSGREITLREMVCEVVDDLGLRVDLRWGARPFSAVEPMHLVADATRAREKLGWEARTRLSYAVWELARAHFPTLDLARPGQYD